MSSTSPPTRLSQEGNCIILELLPELNNVQWGEIDSIGNNVLTEIEAKTNPAMIIDLSALNYMGSAMVALIVRIWKAAEAKKGKICVVCPHDSVQEVLKLAALDKVWPIVDTLDQARGKLGVRGSSTSASVSSPSSSGGSGESGTSFLPWIVVGVLIAICLGLGYQLMFAPSNPPAPTEQVDENDDENENENEETESGDDNAATSAKPDENSVAAETSNSETSEAADSEQPQKSDAASESTPGNMRAIGLGTLKADDKPAREPKEPVKLGNVGDSASKPKDSSPPPSTASSKNSENVNPFLEKN